MPGTRETPMSRAATEGETAFTTRAEVEAGISLGRLGTADEIARSVLFFVSAESYCIGASLLADGGFSAA
jgi:NAD(P)-dependent dehydrogenase (short-subunit alcohol dehydrogenase family)